MGAAPRDKSSWTTHVEANSNRFRTRVRLPAPPPFPSLRKNKSFVDYASNHRQLTVPEGPRSFPPVPVDSLPSCPTGALRGVAVGRARTQAKLIRMRAAVAALLAQAAP